MRNMPQTTEQQIRGADAEANWIALIAGYDIDAVAAACREIAPRATPGVYRLSFCLT